MAVVQRTEPEGLVYSGCAAHRANKRHKDLYIAVVQRTEPI